MLNSKWLKPFLTLTILLILAVSLPSTPIDPWNLLNLKKVMSMIFALALIQILGTVMAQMLGTKTGAILNGFLGGLISSTATTASIARQSQSSPSGTGAVEMITFLSATAAMLFEGTLMLLVGTNKTYPSLLFIFLGPFLVTFVMIFLQSRRLAVERTEMELSNFKIIPILKLAAFILFILVLSQILQRFLGQNGLYVLTFLVSLFEIHGSVIANIQQYEVGTFSIQVLGNLVAISILASYLSKLFIIYTLSSPGLKTRATKGILFLLFSLAASWIIFTLFI